MKTKFFMFLMAFGLMLIAPAISYAQATDDNLDFLGDDSGRGEFGPVSLYSPVHGDLSRQNDNITLNFVCDMGMMTVWIVDENGNMCMQTTVNTSKGIADPIDLKALAAGKYIIICFTPEGEYKADFELYD